MKRHRHVIILTLFHLGTLLASGYSQSINFIDNNGLKQNSWTTTDTTRLQIKISKGQFLNDKKIGKWTYEIQERKDTAIKDCQQLSTYNDKFEFYENDGTVLVEKFEYYRLLSSLSYSKDTLNISGKIFSGDNYALCECKGKSTSELNCILKSKTEQTMETFKYKDFEFYSYRINMGMYDRVLSSKQR